MPSIMATQIILHLPQTLSLLLIPERSWLNQSLVSETFWKTANHPITTTMRNSSD